MFKGKGVSSEKAVEKSFVMNLCSTLQVKPHILKPASLFRSICLEHISSGV